MRLLDASYEQLVEFVQHGDRGLVELLLDEILAVELRKRQRQLEDSYARRANASPQPWLPERRIFC